MHTKRFINICKQASITPLRKVYIRVLFVTSLTPHQRAFVCGACTGTAEDEDKQEGDGQGRGLLAGPSGLWKGGPEDCECNAAHAIMHDNTHLADLRQPQVNQKKKLKKEM